MVTDTKCELTPDGRMQCFMGHESYDSFLKNSVPEFWFKPMVPQDIIASFRVIRKLTELSYFEYEFCDVAALKASLLFEMALKLRYCELTKLMPQNGNPNPQKKNLKYYLDWFKDRNYFEIINPEYLDRIRSMRNYWAHPQSHSYSGLMNLMIVGNTVDLINDLYEDQELRLSRFNLREVFSTKLQSITTGGAYFNSCNFKEVIYNAMLIFIDNKEPKPVYYIALHPTVNFKHENYKSKKGIIVVTNEFEFDKEETELRMKNLDSGTWCGLKVATDPTYMEIYYEFKRERESDLTANNPVFEYSHRLKNTANEYFIKLRRDFHRK